MTHLIWRSILGDLTYNGRPLEIQDHDTYVIVPKLALVGLTFVLLLSLMYLLRWVHGMTMTPSTTLYIVTVTTIILILLFFTWLTGLRAIDVPWRSLYLEVNGTDRIQMALLSHAVLTFSVGVVALFDLTIGYKLLPKKS